MKAHKYEAYKMSKEEKNSSYIHQDHESRITRLEVVIENINSTLARMDKRLDSIETKMDEGFRSVNNRIWNNFYWMVAGFASILATIAHAQHWL